VNKKDWARFFPISKASTVKTKASFAECQSRANLARRWNAQVSHRERRNEHKQEDVLKRKRRVIQNQHEHRSQRVNSERIEKAKKGVIATLRHQNVNPIEWVGE